MSSLLPLCILLALSTAVVVARWRLRAEITDDLDFPRFTAAIAAVIAATTLGVTEIGDQYLDPVLANMWLGENVSDLLKSLYLVTACSLFAGQSLTTLAERLVTERTFDARRCALITCAVIAVLLVVLSRLSGARTTPVDDDFQFDDPAGVAYSLTFWAVILVTALLVTAAAAAAIIDHGIIGQLAAMAMAGGVSAIVASAVLVRLLADHGEMAAWLTTWGQWWTVPGLIGIAVAGLLGIPRPAGLCSR